MNLDELKELAVKAGKEKDYVYLREDAEGRYIEYAFCDEEIPDKRCLCWYNKIQPEKLYKNGHSIKEWLKLHSSFMILNNIYKLSRFTCGEDNNEDPNKRCRPGHPCKNCLLQGNCDEDWTYDEPCKCACYILYPVSLKNIEKKCSSTIENK